MPNMKTPGVYIIEKDTFRNLITLVATNIPAFIGYTEKASANTKPIQNIPTRISSFSEYCAIFGGAPCPNFVLQETTSQTNDQATFRIGNQLYTLQQTSQKYLLFNSVKLFFLNGGLACYIVSVGNYNTPIQKEHLIGGIDQLGHFPEISLLSIPETVSLADATECAEIQKNMLNYCGKAQSCFAIIDIWGGNKHRNDPSGDCISLFRNTFYLPFRSFGAAYYPWLNTTTVPEADVSFTKITNKALLLKILEEEHVPANVISQITSLNLQKEEIQVLHKNLLHTSPGYQLIIQKLLEQCNTLPPSAAIAGVYTRSDNAGVWKAPANIPLTACTNVSVPISAEEQEALAVSTDGISVNVIRRFGQEDLLVWGARTLDGNSQDWRYISTRRTLIMLEQSIKLATKAYIFEPNVANTWITVKNEIEIFLTDIWKKKGLVGTSPEDAFCVHVGLGSTMTPEDILEGILRVTVLVAISHPAEFFEITFSQEMARQ